MFILNIDKINTGNIKFLKTLHNTNLKMLTYTWSFSIKPRNAVLSISMG